MRQPDRHGAAEWLIVGCGAWQVGLGLYFIFVRPALLPEDVRYMGADLQALLVVAPRLSAWLDRGFTVMGGFMAGAGVLIAYFGWAVIPLRLRGTMVVLVSTGALTLGLMSAVNFVLHSDFRWLLVLPPIGWAAAVLLYLARDRPPRVAVDHATPGVAAASWKRPAATSSPMAWSAPAWMPSRRRRVFRR